MTTTNQHPEENDNVPSCIGRIASPPQKEATSEKFQFWIDRGVLVERTQIIRTTSQIGSQEITFYAIVDEVYRQSRKRDIGEEYDQFDGDVNYNPEFRGEGVTFAQASILRTNPPVLTPPLEQSPVFLANDQDAAFAYGVDINDDPNEDNRLPVGLIKNGANVTAGSGFIDLGYLLGKYGGHMNVNGSAGRGTKSSYLLFIIHQLQSQESKIASETPSLSRKHIVPIILNVKGFDLFYIDRWNKDYLRNNKKLLQDWAQIGDEDPRPFLKTRYFAPQKPNMEIPVAVPNNGQVKPYSWGFEDIIELDLLRYLFADEDVSNPNFSALVLDIDDFFVIEEVENNGKITRSLKEQLISSENIVINTFDRFLNWIRQSGSSKDEDRDLKGHSTSTWRMLQRRLLNIMYEGGGVLRRSEPKGNPLKLAATKSQPPTVIDLNSLAAMPSLQRFVVATIFRELVNDRTYTRTPGLVYLVMLDELNRFAPKGSSDPITQLIELVAAEMRSQGIILLGAQQQASKVSEKVIENSGIRVLGNTGTLELGQPVWRFLSQSSRNKAANLSREEKLVIQDDFREPMNVRVPFPVWAMNSDEASVDAVHHTDDDIS